MTVKELYGFAKLFKAEDYKIKIEKSDKKDDVECAVNKKERQIVLYFKQ